MKFNKILIFITVISIIGSAHTSNNNSRPNYIDKSLLIKRTIQDVKTIPLQNNKVHLDNDINSSNSSVTNISYINNQQSSNICTQPSILHNGNIKSQDMAYTNSSAQVNLQKKLSHIFPNINNINIPQPMETNYSTYYPHTNNQSQVYPYNNSYVNAQQPMNIYQINNTYGNNFDINKKLNKKHINKRNIQSQYNNMQYNSTSLCCNSLQDISHMMLGKKINDLETTTNQLEITVNNVNSKLEMINVKLDDINQQLERINKNKITKQEYNNLKSGIQLSQHVLEEHQKSIDNINASILEHKNKIQDINAKISQDSNMYYTYHPKFDKHRGSKHRNYKSGKYFEKDEFILKEIP